MSVVSLTFDNVQTERAFAKLKAVARPAIARALNRSGASGKTAMVREISADLGIKASDVRDTIGVTVAHENQNPQQVSLIATGKRIPLIAFSASGPEPSRGAGRGVSYKIGRGRQRLPHAFIATMRSGKRGVFARTSRGRLPITQLHGPSIPRVFGKYRSVGLARMKEQFLKDLRHEFRYFTDIRKAS